MKKIIIVLTVFSLAGLPFMGCAAKFGRYDPEGKQALRTLAAGAAGALIIGNTGGAIVCAFVSDIYNATTTKYNDKKLENGEEAAERYKDRYKAEEKKKEDKKVKQNEEDKKAGEKKEEEKAEKKKEEDKRVKLFIEDAAVMTQNVKTGSIVEANVQYTLLAPVGIQPIEITETRTLSAADKRLELDKRDIVRTSGTYVSTMQFMIPDDMPKGYCILYTTISVGNYMKSIKSFINII